VILKCIANSARALAPAHVALGYGVESTFDVTIGKEYVVYGIVLWRSLLLLLISDDYSLPHWAPLELFEPIDAKLPEDWFFSTNVANEHGVTAIWGYERLIRDRVHYERLVEGEPDAIEAFVSERGLRSHDS
jgi:hypothetical protein